MPDPKFWRVIVKRGRKAHLTGYVAERGSGDLALCGKPLPLDQRREPPKTVAEPIGDECELCRIVSGHLKRPTRPKPTEEERLAMLRIRRILRTPELLMRMGMGESDAKAMTRNLLGM